MQNDAKEIFLLLSFSINLTYKTFIEMPFLEFAIESSISSVPF